MFEQFLSLTFCSCPFCHNNIVPQLNVYLNEVGTLDVAGDSDQDREAAESTEHRCISVQYLSPLVMRKELENVFADKGESVLSSEEFAAGHSVLFWNLVWAIGRLGLPHHLTRLIWQLHRRGKSFPLPDFLPHRVKLWFMWDNPVLVEELKLAKPLYLDWYRQDPKPLMQQIVSLILAMNMNAAVELMLNARRQRSPQFKNASSKLAPCEPN